MDFFNSVLEIFLGGNLLSIGILTKLYSKLPWLIY